jgi:hypothetical protein
VWWVDLRAALEEHGVSVMHVPAIDVLRDLDGVVSRVRGWLTQLGLRRTA